MTVQNFVKIVWTVFEKFEIFMKRSGEKKQHGRVQILLEISEISEKSGNLFKVSGIFLLVQVIIIFSQI